MENGKKYLVIYRDDLGSERHKVLVFIEEGETHFVFTNPDKSNKEEGVRKDLVTRWQEVGLRG